jgi:hypothetical protein
MTEAQPKVTTTDKQPMTGFQSNEVPDPLINCGRTNFNEATIARHMVEKIQV